jgi:hypothetical protein
MRLKTPQAGKSLLAREAFDGDHPDLALRFVDRVM